MINLKLKNKTILITGATKGIGREIALTCCKEGARCIFIAKSKTNLESLQIDCITLGSDKHIAIPIDLFKLQHIPYVIDKLKQHISMLDGVILAGVEFVSLAPVAHAKGSDWSRMLTVNVLAQQQILFYLEGMLAKADRPKIAFIDCISFQNKPSWAGFQASKDGFRSLANIYKAENEPLNRAVGLFDPKERETDLWRRAFPGKNPSKLKPINTIGPEFLTWYNAL